MQAAWTAAFAGSQRQRSASKGTPLGADRAARTAAGRVRLSGGAAAARADGAAGRLPGGCGWGRGTTWERLGGPKICKSLWDCCCLWAVVARWRTCLMDCVSTESAGGAARSTRRRPGASVALSSRRSPPGPAFLFLASSARGSVIRLPGTVQGTGLLWSTRYLRAVCVLCTHVQFSSAQFSYALTEATGDCAERTMVSAQRSSSCCRSQIQASRPARTRCQPADTISPPATAPARRSNSSERICSQPRRRVGRHGVAAAFGTPPRERPEGHLLPSRAAQCSKTH